MFRVASNGYRAVAHGRRGHGRRARPRADNDIATNADDLAELIEALDPHDAVLAGHSTGGEVRACGCQSTHGTGHDHPRHERDREAAGAAGGTPGGKDYMPTTTGLAGPSTSPPPRSPAKAAPVPSPCPRRPA